MFHHYNDSCLRCPKEKVQADFRCTCSTLCTSHFGLLFSSETRYHARRTRVSWWVSQSDQESRQGPIPRKRGSVEGARNNAQRHYCNICGYDGKSSSFYTAYLRTPKSYYKPQMRKSKDKNCMKIVKHNHKISRNLMFVIFKTQEYFIHNLWSCLKVLPHIKCIQWIIRYHQ